jgi:CheY-specific phosphatase CheX
VRAEYVNAFLLPSVEVLQKMVRTRVTLGRIVRVEEDSLDDNMSVIIGLQGRLSGSVVLAAKRSVARALASRIAGITLGDGDDGDVRAIWSELANTIVGNATGQLFDIGLRGGITPPTVIEGARVHLDFSAGVESVRVPLDTEVGPLEMIVSLTKECP